jgi:hypothetical protein
MLPLPYVQNTGAKQFSNLMAKNYTSTDSPLKKAALKLITTKTKTTAMKKDNHITLTGKETKADICRLLADKKPYWEHKWNERHSPDDFKRESKPELLRIVKIYNANIDGGGDGNISEYRNDEAHSHKFEADAKVKEWLAEFGYNEENIKDIITQKQGIELMDKWRQELNTTFKGFIGKEDIELVFEYMKTLFIPFIPLNTNH